MRDRLKSLRETACVSQSELARLCGLVRQHIQAIECGTILNPSFRVVAELSEALGCSRDYLAYGAGRHPSKRKVLAAIEARRLLLAEKSARRVA
jgi:transcriptional regulator with XRE-family HTH domain